MLQRPNGRTIFIFWLSKGENESECFFDRRCLHILTITFAIFVSLFKYIVLDHGLARDSDNDVYAVM